MILIPPSQKKMVTDTWRVARCLSLRELSKTAISAIPSQNFLFTIVYSFAVHRCQPQNRCRHGGGRNHFWPDHFLTSPFEKFGGVVATVVKAAPRTGRKGTRALEHKQFKLPNPAKNARDFFQWGG